MSPCPPHPAPAAIYKLFAITLHVSLLVSKFPSGFVAGIYLPEGSGGGETNFRGQSHEQLPTCGGTNENTDMITRDSSK